MSCSNNNGRRGSEPGRFSILNLSPPGHLWKSNVQMHVSLVLFQCTLLCCRFIMNPQNCMASLFQTRSISQRVGPLNTLNKPLEAANVLSQGSHFALRPPAIPPASIAELKLNQSHGTATWQQFSGTKKGCDAFGEKKKGEKGRK